MSLQGLPDFHQPLCTEEGDIYYPFEGAGSHALTPTHLEVAPQDDSRPDFRLSFVRGPNPVLPPEPHGVLDFRLRARYDAEKALASLRQRRDDATITPCSFTGGWFRLYPVRVVREDIPADLLRPARLAWNGLGIARCSQKVSQDGASLLEKALKDEQLLFHAKVELEIEGVSPRLPLQVSFNPGEMWRALQKLSDDAGGVTRDRVVAMFRQTPYPVALEITGDTLNLDRAEFAEVMTDRIRMRFGAPASAPVIDDVGYFALSGGDPGEGSFHWDLSEPMRALRPLVLFLHPLEAAQALVREAGIVAVCQRSIVPQLQTGVYAVAVTANLVAQPAGVEALGVTLEAPPQKPFRPRAVVQTVELQAPDFEDIVRLRLSPKEPLAYQYRTYMVQAFDGRVRKLDGEICSRQDDRLLLSPDDFPVSLIVIELAASLAKCVSSVTGRLSWKPSDAEDAGGMTFAFDASCLTLAVSKDSEEATLTFDITAPDKSQTLSAGPVPARNLTLGLHSFPQYGPHTVDIECQFPKGVALYAIDLLGEGQPETEVSVLSFTPNNPRKDWSWFAASPFHAGYRYRRHAPPGEEPSAWSNVQGAFEALRLDASESERSAR